jgi:hypothetical protein
MDLRRWTISEGSKAQCGADLDRRRDSLLMATSRWSRLRTGGPAIASLNFLSAAVPPSLQSYTSRQNQFFCFQVWFRAPLSEILRMHPAVEPDARAVLANQAESPR